MSVFGANEKLKMITHEWLYPDRHLIGEIKDLIHHITQSQFSAKFEKEHTENILYIAYINEEFEELCDYLHEIELRMNELILLLPVVEKRLEGGYIEIVASTDEREPDFEGGDDDGDYEADDNDYWGEDDV